jgi:hypothetical protein
VPVWVICCPSLPVAKIKLSKFPIQRLILRDGASRLRVSNHVAWGTPSYFGLTEKCAGYL